MACSSQAMGLPQAAATADMKTARPPGSGAAKPAEMSEEELGRRLTGRTWYLRRAWLNDSLEFSMHGEVQGHPTTGSFTLGLIRIDKVHWTRRRVELEGTRFALHFLGALPYEDPGKSAEEIRITPKKKVVRIVIAREPVVKPKKVGRKKNGVQTEPETMAKTPGEKKNDATEETTTSPEVAEKTLEQALGQIFAASVDAQMLASLPDYWQLYYEAQSSGHAPALDSDGGGASGAVDRAARLLKAIDPTSNEYAQANGIAGRALYRVVVETNGKPGRIAIMRPIGFGLDEKAIAAIETATFVPAMKAGQPVAETLDMAVMFRIYSHRTEAAGPKKIAPSGPILPGPFSTKAQ